jgi:hypothetical protein
MLHRRILPIVGAFILAGCCGECSRLVGNAFEDPPDNVAKDKLVLSLKTEKDVATNACGVKATGLTDVKVTSVTHGMGAYSKAEIEGKPILAPGVKVSPGKALVCIAVVQFVARAVRNDKNEATDWKITTLQLAEVKTAGVSWTPPSSGGDWDD